MRVSASIGIACFPRDGRAGERLQQAADLAMYQAKADEVGRAAFFEPRLLAELEHRACLEQDLRRALDEGQFELHYQPIYDLDVGLPVATEALVRWRHPRLGLLLPGAFLPLATATGLMLPLGRWVLTEACRQNAQWRRDGVLDAPVAVNIAACQIHHPDFGAEVSAALEAAALPATHLHIDLTEAVASADLPATARALQGLSARGVGVYLDDFGVSGASLAVVRALDVDGVKIDRAVMAGLGGDPQDVAVVGCFVSLARALGLVVIAEGIETRRQLTALQELSQLPSPAARCDRVQGYLLSRPVTAAAIPGVVSRPAVPSLPTPAHPAATLPGPGGPPRNLKLA
jgi:EAL domain-containing protein (putative c-di-GMP-specific phosphodiesterase class I)